MFTDRLKTIASYQLRAIAYLNAIMGGVLLLNLIIGIVLKKVGQQGGSIDMPVLISALIWGYVLFGEVFNFSIMNGVSRKSYFISSCLSFFGLACVTAIIASIFLIISTNFAENVHFYLSVFPQGEFAMFVWFCGALFFTIVLGWFLSILLYSLSKKGKYIFIGVLAVIAPVVILLNFYIDGIIDALQRIGLMFLGVFDGEPNSYLSLLMMLGLSIVLMGASWLFLRRIELK